MERLVPPSALNYLVCDFLRKCGLNKAYKRLKMDAKISGKALAVPHGGVDLMTIFSFYQQHGDRKIEERFKLKNKKRKADDIEEESETVDQLVEDTPVEEADEQPQKKKDKKSKKEKLIKEEQQAKQEIHQEKKKKKKVQVVVDENNFFSLAENGQESLDQPQDLLELKPAKREKKKNQQIEQHVNGNQEEQLPQEEEQYEQQEENNDGQPQEEEQIEQQQGEEEDEDFISTPKKANSNKTNTPFRRVPESTTVISPEFSDNSYWAKGGDKYGEKANEDLGKVHGKGFRAAKTKKKKGSYKGGPIERGVKSVKFHYDDDE